MSTYFIDFKHIYFRNSTESVRIRKHIRIRKNEAQYYFITVKFVYLNPVYTKKIL